MREDKEQAARDALTRLFEEEELGLKINDSSLSKEEKAAA